MGSTSAPKGCGSNISSIYYNLCDLTTLWGVVVEAVCAAGVMTSFILFIILMASLPFVTDKKRKGMVALQASILVFTLGLFGLTFAFIVDQYSTSCAARRFLFGVLFSGCLACLVMHALWLSLLKRSGRGPRSWLLWLGALSLWLVEVIINTEWLVLTVVWSPPGEIVVPDLSCSIANKDFVLSLIYVMVLLVGVVLMAFPSLSHKHQQWRRDGAFILATGVFTIAIWVVWITMYIHGNRVAGNPSWDDPTLAVTVALNAWVFLAFYIIPEICLLTTQEDPDLEEPHDGEHVYPARSLTYDSTLKEPEPEPELEPEPEPAPQNLYIENKSFSMDETPEEPANSTSPYGIYNGQLRSGVYQPTEIALITKGLTMMNQGLMIPRARAPSLNPGSGARSLSRSQESLASQ
ncbi:PREDICTED: G-protein coupled receptor family C group 5 member C-like isoform X2 [Poecilia mexicana]|uniref:G-protein coupled receptor family C group 5 member C-like isoform X2 n=1 Tax=Poecilia mexicana TaxID=48701 RepID=UPI00072DC084|nr:PREDICTED: G-protein coupled receptor family C group 5 member C-like isoform X2 [Poecilia mexicana]XP_014833136.1 PREDICTED: G-protein coupled receptor family C group 5 member C-like isoform X2 [Poecilia mexicana]